MLTKKLEAVRFKRAILRKTKELQEWQLRETKSELWDKSSN